MRRLLCVALLLGTAPALAREHHGHHGDHGHHGEHGHHGHHEHAAHATHGKARATKTDPARAARHEAKGDALAKAGKWALALREYDVADRSETTPARHLRIARCLEKMGKTENAVVIYRRVASDAPDPFEAEEARVALVRLGAAKPERNEGEPLPLERQDDLPSVRPVTTHSKSAASPARAQPASAGDSDYEDPFQDDNAPERAPAATHPRGR